MSPYLNSKLSLIECFLQAKNETIHKLNIIWICFIASSYLLQGVGETISLKRVGETISLKRVCETIPLEGVSETISSDLDTSNIFCEYPPSH